MTKSKFARALLLALSVPAIAQVGNNVKGAAKGGGSGIGNVSGPASSVSGNFPSFNGAGGKSLQDSSYGPTSFAPAGAVAGVSSSQAIHAAEVSACKYYRAEASSLVFTFDVVSGLSANGCIEIETLASAATVTANAADTVTFAGTTSASGGSATLPPYGLYRITIKTNNLDVAGATAQGTGAKVQRASGSTTTGNTVKFNAAGDIIDAGSAPGGSSISPATGIWYPFGKGGTGTGTNITTTKMVLVSHYFPTAVSITQLGINISGSSAGNAQLSLYASGTDNRPLGAPICSTPSNLNTGVATNVAGNCAATVSGLVWCGAQIDNATATFKSYNSGSWFNSDIGASSQAGFGGSSTTEGTEYSVTSTTFGTPPTIGAGGVTEAAQSGNSMPACRFKL
jgi:hypothetical protein